MTSNREIISVNIGGCGVNLGQSALEHYCVEQGISPNGSQEYKTNHDGSIGISFQQTSKHKYYARSLFVDLNPYSINLTKNMYKYRNIIHPKYCVSGKEDCASNWARGHFQDGKQHIDKFQESVRLLVEECDNIQGFVITHSLSGGTGGGMGSLILERLAVDYRKKCKFASHVMLDYKTPSPIQIYNTLLSMHWVMDHTETSIIFDNEQLHTICKNSGIKTPRFKHYNALSAKLISNVTAPFRFGLSYGNLSTFARNMVPFPRMHYLISSLSPMVANMKDVKYKTDIRLLSDECTKSKYFFHECRDFDVEEDKYMALEFNYRGNDISNNLMDINDCMTQMKQNKKFTYVSWSGTNKPSVKLVNSKPMACDREVAMIGNNTCLSRLFTWRITKQYDILYSQRAFVYHLVGWGMYEGELAEAREDLGFLEKDYLDVLHS